MKIYITSHIALTGLILGIFTGRFTVFSSRTVLVSVVFVWLIAIVFKLFFRRDIFIVLAIVLTSLAVGILRGQAVQAQQNSLKLLYGKEVKIEGVITSDSSSANNFQSELELQDLKVEGLVVPGRIVARSHDFDGLLRGTRVQVEGRLYEGFGSVNGYISFAKLIDTSQSSWRQSIEIVRKNFINGVIGSSGEAEGSLGVGFLLGGGALLGDQLEDDLRRSGLTHIVAVSGYNLSILVAFSQSILKKVSRFQAAALGMIAMAVFVFFAGISPSVSRAIVVSVMSTVLWYFGERPPPLSILLWSSALTAFWRPLYLWGDIGWYLSFLAFYGVLIVAPKLQALLTRGPDRPRPLLSLLLETTSAQLLTTPLIVLVFGRLSITSITANLLAGPIVPLAMVTSFLTGIISLFSPVLAGLIGAVNRLVVGLILLVARVHSAPSWAQIEIKNIWPIFFIAIFLVLFMTLKRTRSSRYSTIFFEG